MVGSTGSYGGYEMYTIDWDANTAVFSGANYVENNNIGHSGAVTLDGKYVLIFHNDSNSPKIFKNNDAGDWSSATDVTSDFTFNDADDDQGHDISFCGENSEYFLSGMRSGNLRMYRWYPKKEVTLTFSNPTLTLTGQNVTISSAKLYRDDVLFHTYGTETKVVLRSDQTGTYQAIVNDVYYSNRITPDFTTTRSVSAPQLVFDGYNKLHLSNSTPTSTTLGLPDGTTRDLTTQSNVYIYETGTYTANVQTSDTFAYLSNVVTSQPSQNSADVGPTFTFDGYNKLAIENITQTSSTLKYGSNTYDTNTASNVYVTDAGEYKLEARDANTFVMSNVYVGGVSQHPSDVVPTLTFDGYNKLTIDNVDTVETATIKKDGAAFATTTSNTVYIRDTGTYTAEVKGSNVYAIKLSNVVSGSVNSQRNATYKDFIYKITRTTSTWDNFDRTHNPPLVMSLTTTMHSTLVTLGYTEGFYSSAWYILESDTHDFAAYRHGNSVVHTNWGTDGTATVVDGTDTAYFTRTIPSTVVDVSGTYKVFSGALLTFDGYNKITVTGTNYEDTATVTYYSNAYNLGTAKTMYVKDTGEYVFKISGTDKYVESNVYVSSVDLAGAPTKPIDFDGYNKLTLIDAGSNVSANVTYFSNTYELGSANVLYINGAGTYDLEMSGSNVFALSSNVVGTVSQQHPTDVVPSLTFDNYNKLTLENFTTSESDTRTAKLTDPNGNTYSLSQTQNDIYIEDTGEYILEVTNSDQSAVVTKNVGTVSQHPTDVVPSLTFDTYNKLSIGNLTPNSSSLRFGSNTYDIGTASNVYIEDAGTYKVATGAATTFALVSNVVTGTPSQHPTDVVPSLTYDNANKLSIENLTPTSTTLTDPNGSSFDIGTASNVYIRDSGTYSIASKDANTFVLASNTVTGTPTGTTYVYDSNTFTTPSQTYDTTKTITVKDIPTDVAGKIYKGSTAYTIHATTSSSNVIIKNAGTYVSVFTTATQAFLTNAIGVTTQPTTTSDDTTIEDVAPSTSVDITLAFHYAGFVATDYNSAYATKEAAAANGFVYADTPDGTYSWGTLTVTSNTTSNTQYTWAISGTGIVDYLVVAGGGAGGNDRAGGGGAGGYRTSVSGDLSGGSTSSETPLSISSGTYSIIVGNGGQWGGETGDTSPGPNGNDSVFHTITSLGGGGGASEHAAPSSGGSGGGGAYYHSSIGNNGTAGQGTSGASGYENFPSERRSGGGGGASSAANLKDGGDGLSSTITGTPVIRGGGGGD